MLLKTLPSGLVAVPSSTTWEVPGPWLPQEGNPAFCQTSHVDHPKWPTKATKAVVAGYDGCISAFLILILSDALEQRRFIRPHDLFPLLKNPNFLITCKSRTTLAFVSPTIQLFGHDMLYSLCFKVISLTFTIKHC